MKIAAIQFNPVVGDIHNNVSKMIELSKEAEKAGADVIVFGECSTVGYPVEDLTFRPAFVAAAELETERFVKETADLSIPVVFGSIVAEHPSAYNVGIASLNGKILGIHKKNIRANGYMFDEIRQFQKGSLDDTFSFMVGDKRVGIVVCEDLWHREVVEHLKTVHKVDTVIAINGSPYESNKFNVRDDVCLDRWVESKVDIAYINLVGGQDSTVFDGQSFLMVDGRVVDNAPAFQEGIFVLDFDKKPTFVEWSTIEQDYCAAVLGLRDFVRKQGFKKVVFGLSGGLDSSIVALMAADALGADNITAVSLPSKYSSEGSKDDAYEQAKRMGLKDFRVIEIEPVVQSLRNAYNWQVIPGNPDPQDFSRTLTGVADENIQARARANILLSISNQEGQMLLGTSNRSELFTGYGTYGGDLAGFFNPVQDFYKSYLFEVARWRNKLSAEDVERLGFFGLSDIELLPNEIITKPPSAELSPDQKDSDSLPPYEVLDAIIHHLVADLLSVQEVVLKGFDILDVEKVNNLIYRAEFKRRQGPPGVRLSSTHINIDRRYPIVNKWR